jgi:hypothetical protein
MTAKQHFFLYFFLIIAVPTFAQITKNSKTIGSANLGYESSSYLTSSSSNLIYESSNYSTGLNVSGPLYMVTNRLQLGLGFGVGFSKNDNYEFNSNYYEFYTKSLVLTPEITYYFTKNNKGFYANVGGEYNPFSTKRVNKTSPNQETSESIYFYKARLGIGYIKPINDNVFLNYHLGYERSNIANSVDFSLGLSNFVPSFLGDKMEDTQQYIVAGRSIISGSFSAKYFDISDGKISILGSFERLKFRNTHFALGYYGSAFVSINPDRDDFYYFNGGTKARYYIQMSKKWFIYPELGLGLELTLDNTNKRNDLNLDFVKSVGFNYFVTPNIALDANIDLNFNMKEDNNTPQISSSSNLNSSLRIGVTYFIDKLF